MREIYKNLFSKRLMSLNKVKTLKDFFELIESKSPQKPMFIYDNKTYFYQDFLKKVETFTIFLEEKLNNFEKDSWVGIKLSNHPFYLAMCFAILKSGFNVIFIDDKVSKDFLTELIKKVGISAIITDAPGNYDFVLNIDFNQAIFSTKKGKKSSNCFADKVGFCSSGTEGYPKVVVHSGRSLISGVLSFFNGLIENFSDQTLNSDIDKIFIALPFFHIFGIYTLFMALTADMVVITTNTKSLSSFIKNIKNNHCQFVAHVPLILDSLFNFIKGKYKELNPETFRKIIGADLKFFISGGAKKSEKSVMFLNRSNIQYFDVYGSTEAGIITINNKICCRFPDSKIKVLKKYRYFNKGLGELVISNPSTCVHIINDNCEQQSTAKKVLNFINTGDLVEVADSKIFINGRKSDIIISSNGENIAPAELEKQFDFLKNCTVQYTVIGLNEFPVLVVVLENNKNNIIRKKDIINKVIKKNKEMVLYKRIVSIYFTKTPLPLTQSCKIKKIFLKEQIINNKKDYEKVSLINKQFSTFTLKSIVEDLRNFFAEYLNLSTDKIKNESLIIEELGVNSIVMAELLIYIEEKYKIEIDEEFILKNSLSIQYIANKIFAEI